MSNPVPDRLSATATFYHFPVKKLKTDDRIDIGGIVHSVLGNRKNSSGGRVITCRNFRNSEIITIIFPKGTKVRMTQHKVASEKELEDLKQ